VESVTYFHPGAREPVLRNISFGLKPGEVMGLIGPSAAGKTTLARLIVGNLKPQAGHVRLAGADVANWPADELGRHIGYLPQDVEMFEGTVHENIARMATGDSEQVVTAARLAGVHELVLRLNDGYDTQIGEGGAALSGGERQRIALARAVYGEPSLVVLDEPNASLDHAGEDALLAAIGALKARGATVIVIAHRPNILRQADKILVLREGTVQAFGPRNEIFAKLFGPRGNEMIA
jgi:ABC-type protease/lipase transport system fused ATPase/permease subunit